MSTKFVYSFDEGNKDMRSLLGGKGANLAEMTNIGLPVPQGFTITTEACNDYYEKKYWIKSMKNWLNWKKNREKLLELNKIHCWYL